MLHDTREQLLQATGRLMMRLGYSKTSVADIAQEAGLSRATAYLYFPNKEAMLTAWLEHRAELFQRELGELSRHWNDPWERLEETLKARILLRLDRVESYAAEALQDILRAREALLAGRPEAQRSEAQLLEALILEANPAHPSAAQTALMLVLASEGLRPSSLSEEQLRDRATLNALAQDLCAFLVQAVRQGARS